MPTIHRASIAEPFEAWLVDDAGELIDLSTATVTASIYNPANGLEVVAPWPATVVDDATGDGTQLGDVANVLVVFPAPVAALDPARYRLRVDALIGGTHLVRTWPLTIRPS